MTGSRQPSRRGGFDDRLIADISRAVSTIHPAMAWELGPGRTAQHAFCISPEGNAELRQVALRWVAAAPPVDATWEYHPSKQAAASLSGVAIGPSSFDFPAMRAITSWDEQRQRVDVRLWHPGFDGAPQQVKLQVAFLFLDNLLGEDDVERWVGQIDILDGPDRRADTGRAEGGGRAAGRRIERRRELGSRDHVPTRTERPRSSSPTRRSSGSITRLRTTTSRSRSCWGSIGCPTRRRPRCSTRRRTTSCARLGGAAIFVGRTTAAGVRTLHYVTEAPDAMRPAIDAWAASLPDSIVEGLPARRIKVNFEPDMDWSFRSELGLG